MDVTWTWGKEGSKIEFNSEQWWRVCRHEHPQVSKRNKQWGRLLTMWNTLVVFVFYWSACTGTNFILSYDICRKCSASNRRGCNYQCFAHTSLLKRPEVGYSSEARDILPSQYCLALWTLPGVWTCTLAASKLQGNLSTATTERGKGVLLPVWGRSLWRPSSADGGAQRRRAVTQHCGFIKN